MMFVSHGTKPLWLDDYIGNLSKLIASLKQHGVETDTSTKSPGAYGYSKLKKRRRLILDSKFGEGLHDGVECALRLANNKDTRIIVFSAFLDAEKRREPLQLDDDRQSAILYLVKRTVETCDADKYFSMLSNCFSVFFKSNFDDLNATIVTPPKKTIVDDFLGLGFDVFENLPLPQKAKLYTEFRALISTRLEELFDKNAIWVLFAGTAVEPYMVAYRSEQILSTVEVSALCEEMNVVPYIFRRDVRVDSTFCVDASSSGGSSSSLTHYPFAEITFNSTSESDLKNVPFHFDTGADYSFFCDAFLTANKIEKHKITTFGEVVLGGIPCLAEEIELDILVVNPKHGPQGKKVYAVKIKALAVNGWSNSGLSILCQSSCKGQKSRGGLCLYRRFGLLGRTIYARDDFDLFIEYKTSQVSFLKNGN